MGQRVITTTIERNVHSLSQAAEKSHLFAVIFDNEVRLRFLKRSVLMDS